MLASESDFFKVDDLVFLAQSGNVVVSNFANKAADFEPSAPFGRSPDEDMVLLVHLRIQNRLEIKQPG
jgi:hypothetical protein